MKFLADENVEKPVVDWLRKNGFDVLFVTEFAKSSTDDELLERAKRDSRILLTNDKDFGELVFLQRKSSAGVILMRFTNDDSSNKVRYISHLMTNYSDRLEGNFTVINETKVRFRNIID
jgi:predicted nuclease of predicted toxin-antitoxin system